MEHATDSTIVALGRAAAEQVAGADAVHAIDVEPDVDRFERPAYRFTYLIDQDHTGLRAGLLLSRLIQQLRDDLEKAGDERLPLVRILSREDWPRRHSARPF